MIGDLQPTRMPGSNVSPRGRGFYSYKCTDRIEYTRRCCRDALIQATLEPEISRISPLSMHGDDLPDDSYFSFLVHINGRDCAIALCDVTSTPFDPPYGCDAAVAISSHSVQAEHVCTTSRLVWSRRHHLVPPLFSVRLMGALRSNPAGMSLGALDEYVARGFPEWIDFSLAMACAGLVALEYRQPVSDQTTLKLGPAASSLPEPTNDDLGVIWGQPG